MSDTECMVCIEKFNKSTRKPVVCPYCSTSICRTCIQTCLLKDNTPVCQMPECKKAWSDEFLSASLTKVWLDSAYKAHREKILLDQEKARLPESQEQAAIYINSKVIVDDIQPRITALEAQVDELPLQKQRAQLSKERYDMTQSRAFRDAAFKQYYDLEKDALKEAKPLRKQIKALKSEAFKTAKKHVEAFGRPLDEAPTGKPAEEKKWTFVGKCPKTECMGFVGMDYACGLCKVEVCKDCMESKQAGHTCNTDNVLNVKAMRKEAKPCPKCAAMISKIDGCDQMWCTQCHTAFSWRTGAEETMVHNPHFYEWMRRTGKQMAPGAVNVGGGAGAVGGGGAGGAGAGAALAGCGFRGVWNAFQTAVHTVGGKALYDILQGTAHINDWVLTGLNNDIRSERARDEEAKRVLRVRRLATEITEAEWKKPLERMEQASKRRHAKRDIYDMYIQAAMTIMDQFTQTIIALHQSESKTRCPLDSAVMRKDATHIAVDALCKQYTELATYVNQELHKLGNRMSTSVIKVTTIVPPSAAITTTA